MSDCPPGFRLEDGKCVPDIRTEMTCFRCGFRIDRVTRYCGGCGQLLGTDDPPKRPDNLHCEICYNRGHAAGRAEVQKRIGEAVRANVDAASIEIQQETIRLLKADFLALQKRIDDAPRRAMRDGEVIGDIYAKYSELLGKPITYVALVPVEAPDEL